MNTLHTRRRPLGLLLIAALLLPAGVLTHTPKAAAQDNQAQEDPGKLFQQAIEHYKAKRFKEAIPLFKRVFELDPNPFVLYNIGRCYEELGQLDDAARHYERSLLLDGLPESAKAEAIKRLARLEDTLKEQGDREKIASSREVVALAMRMAVSRASSDAADAAKAKAEADKGDKATDLPPPPPPPAQRGALTWIGIGAAGLGALAVGAGTVFYLSATDGLDQQDTLRSDYNTLRTQALEEGDSAAAASALEKAQELNTLADDIEGDQVASTVMFSAGGALLLGGLIMILVDGSDEGAQQAEGDDATGASIIVVPGGIGVSGTW